MNSPIPAINGEQGDELRQLKSALTNRAGEFCISRFPAGQHSGTNFLVGSLDGAPGKSLSICITGARAGLWKDFATGECGNNLLELLRTQLGCTFAEACCEARAWLGWRLPSHPFVNSANRITQPLSTSATSSYCLTEDETARGTGMAERLLANVAACESIASRRGWAVTTVIDLASEASLGQSEQGRLTFLYDTGAKERWRENGERRMRFLFGKPDALWRGGLLTIARRVIVTEGETDAISLVDAGAEQDDETLVVALPSASTLKRWWGVQFASKDVLLCMDGDPAGQKATEKLKSLLAPHVASLRTVDLEVLLK